MGIMELNVMILMKKVLHKFMHKFMYSTLSGIIGVLLGGGHLLEAV